MAKPFDKNAPTAADEMSNRAESRAHITKILNLTRGTVKAAGESNAILDDPFAADNVYGSTEVARRVLIPPMGEGSLRVLVDMVDESNILRQCIEAYQTNVDGFGYRFDLAVPQGEFPESLKAKAKTEEEALTEFFDYGYAEGSFEDLRKRIRWDREATGCGYMEVLREVKTGQVNRVNHVPSYTLRQTVYDPDPVVVEEHRMVGLSMKTVKVSRRFRTFVQIQFGAGKKEQVWFKEFGDPRNMDKTTGKFVGAKSKANLATEIMPFRSGYHPTSPYSTPRWIGNLPSVLGSRAAEEINLMYFDNKTIPPMVVTVSGGALTKGTIKRIENLINHKLKGRENFHEPLILEAQPVQDVSGNISAPKIEIKPLTEAATRDALFMGYDGENRKKARSSFRLTPLYTGESEDLTRATAEASQHVVEEQVFRPERVSFDYVINRWLLPELGAMYHKFVSLGPNVTLNEDLVSALTSGETAGGMTPNIARRLLSDITESDIPQIEEEWGDVPFSLTIAQMRALAPPPAFGGGQEQAQPPVPKYHIPKGLLRGILLEEVKREVKLELAKRKRFGG